jgi:hypothetical protein
MLHLFPLVNSAGPFFQAIALSILTGCGMMAVRFPRREDNGTDGKTRGRRSEDHGGHGLSKQLPVLRIQV